MRFSSDSQRRAVMAQFSQSPSKEDIKVSMGGVFPIESFSKKDERGAVPLLPSTYVIRGGRPNDRKKVKDILELVGSDPVMSNINQIRILSDVEEPVAIEGDKTVVLNEKFLEGSEFETSILVLATVHRQRHPEEQEGREFVYAREVVEPKIKEEIRREISEREIRETEVFQAGVDVQPDFEVVPIDGPEPEKFDVRVTPAINKIDEAQEVSNEDLMVGVSGLEKETFSKTMDKQLKDNMYLGN